MERPEITKLYKYRAFNEYALDIIENEKFWVPTPDAFNDPFDCSLEPGKQKTTEDMLAQLNDLIDELYTSSESKEIKDEIFERNRDKPIVEVEDKQLKNHFEDSKRQGIFSLSEKPDQILMWSHYADNHTGFCVEFERSDYELNFLSHFMCQPVKYSKTYPDLHRVIDLWKINLYTKALEWSYETEWRLVFKRGNMIIPAPAPITGIIMGLKITDEHKNEIKRIVQRKPKVKLYQAERRNGEFALDIVETESS